MEKNRVCIPVRLKTIAKEHRAHIIPVHMFLKDKFKANGAFDKTKARMVAGGNHQDADLVGDTFAPTVNPISVFTQLQITVAKQHLLSAYDIKGAFLLSRVKDDKFIYLMIPPDIAAHWIRNYPERMKYVERNGCMYVRLNKYMYGLQESPHEFNSLLNDSLISIGFKRSKADKCLYTKQTDDGLMIVSAHVDDLLVTSPSKRQQKGFERDLKKSFELVCQYDDLSYLGMKIQYDKQGQQLKVSQPGYIRDLLKRFGYDKLQKFPPTPATDRLFQNEPESPPCDKRQYQSLIMSLMYAARFTQPAILTAVSALSTKCANPTESDYKKLTRVLRYLAGSMDRGIVFDGSKKLSPMIYADAGHASHNDARGHGGIIITLGSAPVLCRSFKLKQVTRSSSESELVVLEEASTYAVWFRLLLSELGLALHHPVPVFQDNKSTIIIAQNGGNFARTKHLLVKESYVAERIQDGDIVLKYLPTDEICADMLTKPLPSSRLMIHLHSLYAG